MNDSKSNHNDDELDLVSFLINQEIFAINILLVQEVNKMLEITRVPNTSHYIKGVINLRGKVVPIVNMRLRLDMAETDYNKNTRIVVVQLENKVIGLIVDEVSKAIRINKSITEPTPLSANKNTAKFIQSIANVEGKIVNLLDLNKLLLQETL